jgi:hypothetical protein
MTQLSKTMQQAVDTVRGLPPEQQDFLAVELMERAHLLTQPSTRLSPEERAELEAELAAAKRGEFASEAEVAAMYAKHGL